MRKTIAVCVTLACALAARGARAADDASAGYRAIRPSLVKVWAFDKNGRPTESGTGLVIASDAKHSSVLTATHVIAGAASIRIDVDSSLHDLKARVERTGPRDLSLLAVDRGDLHAARFAPRSRAVVEGNVVAVAGYVKHDELIGIAGQQPRVLFPGTIASRPENGIYLELENVQIEAGLSGGPVFDPATGDVLGIVTARTSDQRGGFADSGAQVVVPFVTSAVARAAPPTPPTPQPLPPLPPLPPRALPAPSPPDVDWQMTATAPKRFVYERAGCRIAVTVALRALRFSVSDGTLIAPRDGTPSLDITLQQRASATDACADVPDSEPMAGTYEPVATSFDGRHVTMRFVYAGDPALQSRFPGDASLDADLGAASPAATVQFFDRDWSGAIDVPLGASGG